MNKYKLNIAKIIFLLNISLFINSASYSQYQNIDFGVTGYYFPNEPSVMINPKNTNQIVVGTNYYYYNIDTALSSYYYSTNGGLNWQGGPLISSKARSAGDPVLIADTNGYFYYFTLTNWGRTDWLDYLLCLKSTNGGKNWNDGMLFGYNSAKDMDKPWACVDLTNGVYGNSIYVTWTEFDKYGSYLTTDSTHILFSKSTNGGINFSHPKRINKQSGLCNDSTNTVEGAVPCVGINGEIYVVWAGWTNLYFNKSTDGGSTWFGNERIVAQQVGGWKGIGAGITSYNGFPIIVCDNSNSTYRGNIYINWVDQRSGLSDQNVWIIKSTNGGENWSTPLRVNTDSSHRNQFLTWMTIDRITGYIYCVFYDRRNSPSFYTDVYLARSTNGGASFTDVKVNTSSINMINYRVGDYINISAHNKKVRPVWIYSVNLTNKIFTAIIDTFYSIGINKISSEIPEYYSLKQNYPNPFNSSTIISYQLSVSGCVKLLVYDMLGREITTLVNETLQPGTYEVKFDVRSGGFSTELASGIYYYRMETENFTDTKKMILIK